MGTWFWLNVPLMLLFLGSMAGIPMWHTLNRWHDEVSAKHAELAARGLPVPVPAQRTPATAAVAVDAGGSPAFAGVASE